MFFACFAPGAGLGELVLRWLAFRVMLGAGLSKLGAHASVCWRDFSCTQVISLVYEFESDFTVSVFARPTI